MTAVSGTIGAAGWSVNKGCLSFPRQLFGHLSLPLCFCFFLSLIPLLFVQPQVCRFNPGDAEADCGADAGRCIAELYLVHAHVPEPSHPPPLHFRWVKSGVAVKVTLMCEQECSS